MAGCSFLFHSDKQGVLITICLDAFDMLEMARCGSLMPKLIFWNGSSNAFVWSQGLTDRTAHSYSQHEHLSRLVICHNDWYQSSLFVKIKFNLCHRLTSIPAFAKTCLVSPIFTSPKWKIELPEHPLLLSFQRLLQYPQYFLHHQRQ